MQPGPLQQPPETLTLRGSRAEPGRWGPGGRFRPPQQREGCRLSCAALGPLCPHGAPHLSLPLGRGSLLGGGVGACSRGYRAAPSPLPLQAPAAPELPWHGWLTLGFLPNTLGFLSVEPCGQSTRPLSWRVTDPSVPGPRAHVRSSQDHLRGPF